MFLHLVTFLRLSMSTHFWCLGLARRAHLESTRLSIPLVWFARAVCLLVDVKAIRRGLPLDVFLLSLDWGTKRGLTASLSSSHYLSCCSHSLHVLSTGNGNFTVRKAGQSYGNRVKLVFGTDGTDTVMTCTCAFVTRFKIPCGDIIAVGRGEHLRFIVGVGTAYCSSVRLRVFSVSMISDFERFAVQLKMTFPRFEIPDRSHFHF